MEMDVETITFDKTIGVFPRYKSTTTEKSAGPLSPLLASDQANVYLKFIAIRTLKMISNEHIYLLPF